MKKMRKEYFRTVFNENHYFGVVENIPEEVSLDDVKERIQTVNSDNEWVELVSETYEDPELIIDWETIDYEMDIDEDMISVISVLEESEKHNLNSEVVYTSLKFMKENPTATISDAISFGCNEWVK